MRYFFIFIAAFFTLAPFARATTYTVTSTSDSGPGSLRNLVANASPGDTIVFADSLAGQTILLTNGSLTVSNSVTIDGSSLATQVQVEVPFPTYYFGGTFVITNATVQMNSLTIIGNYVANSAGAGIANYGSLTISNVTVSGGWAHAGSGIGNFGTMIVDNSTVTDGTANDGGGIANFNSMVINNSVVTHNQANAGDGGISNGGMMTLNNCTVGGNRVIGGSGGGIGNGGTLILNNSTVVGNWVDPGSGGGIDNVSTLILNNSTVTGNLVLSSSGSGGEGGGVLNEGGMVTMNNSTIANNSADSGGGIDNIFSGIVNLTNTIVSLNTGGDIYGSITSGASNLVGRADIALAPLDYYGGPTMTMPPLPGSPAIDQGSDAVTNFLITDQRGAPRKVGLHVDIGAVEGIYNPAGVGPLTGMKHQDDGSVQFSFTNFSDMSFSVLASTNVSLPLN